ncbi:MAG: glycosyltransferase family A protein [Halobacteriales archaeon]|nr:glycosyltransferase family A protein [Halobacteriales archaeon]
MSLHRAIEAHRPEISVVIPSVPENDHRPTVECLAEQSIDRAYEVIVVNDASVDRSQARNQGLRAAEAPIVALTDDDTRPPFDWLEIAHREFARRNDLICLEGPIYGGCRNFGPRDYVGCNLAVDREAALAVGGFRSAFSEWREDVEFGWRMEKEGDGVCRYCTAFRMCHPSVPRTALKPALERRLQEEYPHRYDEIMNATWGRRLHRRARAAGITQPIQRIRNAIKRLRHPNPCRRPSAGTPRDGPEPST